MVVGWEVKGSGGESEEMEHIWECEEVARIVEQKEKTKFIKEYILHREIVEKRGRHEESKKSLI